MSFQFFGISDVGKKDSPPKKPRLHPLDNTRLQFDSRSSSSTLTDSSRTSCTPNTLGPPVLFKPQVGAAHPPLIKMPWLSPAPSLFNHSPYAPPLAAAPLTLTPRDAFTTQVSPSLQPSGPPMIPFSKLHSRVIMAPNSSKVLKPPGRLSGTSTAADPQRVQDTPSAGQPAASSSPAIVSRAGQVVAHPPHPQLVTHPETEFNSSLPRLKTFTPSSVAAKPPPLIPLPVIEKQMDILNNKPNTPHYSVVPISSPITPGETPKEETVSDWPDSCTQVSSTSHDAELRRVPSVAKETDQVVVKKESHDRAGSLLSHGIIKSSNMSYVSTASTSVSRDRQPSSVPNASPKVSSSSVGMTTSPMVFIPATVAFATLGTQMSPHTSNVTSSSLQVKPNLKVSRPVSSVTSSVPQQFYWILTPAEASPFSVDSSHKPPKPSMSSRTYTWSPAVSGPSPPESTVLSPTPVSSSSYLASLLKAGVPLVPVSSTATVATVSPSTSYVSPLSLSNTTVSTKISLPAPIMSTPAIITNPSSLLGHNNVKKYKSSRPGPKSKKLAATGKVKVPPDLGTLAPPPLTAMCGTASSQHQSVLTSGVSSSTLFLEDNFRVNDLINTLLGETTAVRQIMAAVTADHNNEANSAAKTPKQSSKKHGKSPEHSARTTKFSPKKHGSKGNSGGQMKLKKDQSSVVASRVVPTSETLGDYASVNVVRIEQESTVGGRDSEEGDGGLPVPSSSGIITNSQDDGSSPSEPPVLPAKVDYVPAISRVKQSGLYFPPLLKKYQTIKTVGKKSGHHTSSSPKKSGSSKSSKQKALCMPPLVRHEKIDATNVLQRKVCVKLELMTHRHIKKAFLKKHQISLMSGILLRRQLRNWDIKRYLTSQKNFRLPLLPQGSKPSVGSSKEQRRMPKVGPLGSKSASVQQMLLAARTGAEPESWPVTQDASAPSTSAAPRPHKHKSQGTKPPRLTFMGENKEAATSKASSAADQSISDRTSEMISQGIITCSKQPLMVFQNERLTNGQKNFLGKIGLNLAKRVSRNSDLDSLEGSQILMDPGMFGLKAKSHPPPTWSLVLDDQGSKIEASASVKPPPASRGQPTKGTGKGSGHKQGGKGKQRKQAYSVAVSAPQMYTTAALPPGQVYTTTFMAPGQMAGQPQFRILAQVPDGQDANASLASLSERAQAVSGQRRIYVPAVMPTGPPAGIPSAAVVQTPTSSVGARILTVDHAGRVRETLSQGIPAAYSRYSTSAQRPDNWNPSRPSNRGSPPPPLTFMGVGGSSNNMKPPRGMPPPLSFMGSCSEAPTRPDLNFSSSQSSPRPLQAVGWTQALDLSQQASAPRNFGVINHTRHLIPEKRPPNLQYTAQGHIGVDQRPPALTYSVPGQEQGVTDRQPSRSTGVVQGPTNHNQQQFNVSHTIQDQRPPGLPQTTQGQFPINLRPPSLTQTAQVHVTVHQQPSLPRSVHGQIEASQQPTSLPQDIQRPPTISNQLPGWLQNSHRQIEVAQRPLPVSHSGQGCATSNHSSQGQVTVDQRPPSLPCTIQVSSAPSLQTPVSSQTGTPDSRYNRSPAEFGFSVDDPEHHHHHHHHTPSESMSSTGD
ncbi:hypothetical protein Hamer_G010451 [Homarus americanus]|uniref:Uncharacterized protein n=1 Tax=Homarus americanus TaxID=6706 RepID=A0A8J5JYA2_HOMAM|nr:hypothetical protein Hamer_G010451 [Homarus americanus]